MISPIGSFLVQFDANITTGMQAGITGLTGAMLPPMLASCGLWFMTQGLRVANGDAAPQQFALRVARMVVVLWICSNAAIYNQYVTNFFYQNLPNAVSKAVMANTGGDANGPGYGIQAGVTGTAAVFDHLWAESDVQVAKILQQSDFFDVASKAAAEIGGAAGGLLLVIIAMVYEAARFILAVVLELGVLAIACLIFDATVPIFERWLGKVIALVFLQVAAIVVLQIVLKISDTFVQQIATTTGGVPEMVQGLTSIVVLYFMGAFAVYSLPAIAYSIGTGVAIQTMAPLMLAMRSVMGAAGLASGISIPETTTAETGLTMGLANAELGGGANGLIAPDLDSLPPPPVSGGVP